MPGKECSAFRVRADLPDHLRGAAATLYWDHFGRQILPLPMKRTRGRKLVAEALRPAMMLAALTADSKLIGVLGLRDDRGGALDHGPDPFAAAFGQRVGRWLHGATLLYSAGPETCDMVIDGLAVLPDWRNRGVGRALIAEALTHATLRGHPGLTAEVARRNHGALQFYATLGFERGALHKIGWPWSGRARVMRLALQPRSVGRSSRLPVQAG